jgi:GNAT superfamily N-acetyltransferase
MSYEKGGFEREVPSYQEQIEREREAERRLQEAKDLPQYQQNGDGSYQRHFADRQGRDVTLRVDGDDEQTIQKVEAKTQGRSACSIRIRAADTAEVASGPAYRGKGEMAYANTTLEIQRDGNGHEVDRRLRLNDIKTNDDRRNSGVGGEMLDEAERIGEQHGASEIYGNLSYEAKDEAAVRHFYQKHGFEFRPIPSGGKEVYKPLNQPESDGAAVRREARR